MKVFISWSGERSHALANALRDWLPLVLHYVEPWLSQADIEAGQRWAEQVAKELEAANFGILCVNRDNVGSPWVLFEAGALAKSMQGSRVIPLLLDLEFRDVSGPLAQFQAKKVDRAGVWDVAVSLNQAASHPVPEEKVKQLFDALWGSFEEKVTAIPNLTKPAKPSRSQADILEELVTGVRSLESRFRDIAEEGPRGSRRRRRLHPEMLHELSHVLGSSKDEPIALLLIASLFREEAPWLHELGLEAYRVARTGSPKEAFAARRRFQKAADYLRHGPFDFEESGLDLRMVHMLLRDLDHLVPPALPPREADKSDPPEPRRKKGDPK